jgi:hypothetical protein
LYSGRAKKGEDRIILRPPPRQTEAGEEYREISWVRLSNE